MPELSDDDSSVVETFEPCIGNDNQIAKDQTTMFLNKYLDDTNIPTVANRLSDIIIEYEVAKNISSAQLEDAELDDEIVNEEEFLANVEEMDNFNSKITSENATNKENFRHDSRKWLCTNIL